MLFNNKTNGKQEKSSILSDNDIWKKRADILYPDMETKEEDSVFDTVCPVCLRQRQCAGEQEF